MLRLLAKEKISGFPRKNMRSVESRLLIRKGFYHCDSLHLHE